MKTMLRARTVRATCLAALLVAAAPLLPAQTADVPADPQIADQAGPAIDPPARVGRLADVSGAVWLYSPDTGDWVQADRNRPLTTGDRLATDAGARAVLTIGSTTLRLDGSTELELAQLDDGHIDLRLHSGSVSARLRDGASASQFSLATVDGRFVTPRTGSFRFDIAPQSSDVTVWSGQATYQGPGSALNVGEGQRGSFWLDTTNAAQYTLAQPANDAFAAWTFERDRAEQANIAATYVSPEMTGAGDLAGHGAWQDTADYGALWLPSAVAADWAPYSSGHWAWVSPWGWSWIDDASWGFAPFHYGRWVRYHERWGWAPGSYVAHPCYAPALVGWVGGAQINLAFGGRGAPPAVGWFPLAPHEVYVPSYRYRVSPIYVRNVNITHVTNITNVTNIVHDPQAAVRQYDYQNRRFAPAVTMVPASVLTSHSAVGPAAAQFRQRGGPNGRNGAAPTASPQLPGAFSTLVAPPVAPPALRTDPAIAARHGSDGGRRDDAVPSAPIQQRFAAPARRFDPSNRAATMPSTEATRPVVPPALGNRQGATDNAATARRSPPEAIAPSLAAPNVGSTNNPAIGTGAPPAVTRPALPLPPGAFGDRRSAQPVRPFGGADARGGYGNVPNGSAATPQKQQSPSPVYVAPALQRFEPNLDRPNAGRVSGPVRVQQEPAAMPTAPQFQQPSLQQRRFEAPPTIIQPQPTAAQPLTPRPSVVRPQGPEPQGRPQGAEPALQQRVQPQVQPLPQNAAPAQGTQRMEERARPAPAVEPRRDERPR